MPFGHENGETEFSQHFRPGPPPDGLKRLERSADVIRRIGNRKLNVYLSKIDADSTFLYSLIHFSSFDKIIASDNCNAQSKDDEVGEVKW